MKKRLKFLVAMVFATLLSANVFAYDFVVNGIYYNKIGSGNAVSVTYGNTYNSYSGSVNIPSTVSYDGYTYFVARISSAFENCTGLTSVTIPYSVTSIIGQNFSNCPNLLSIDVDNNNTKYSSLDGVLYNKLQDTIIHYPAGKSGGFIIPNSVTSIGDRAFSECSSLSSITIPNGVTSIGEFAFDSCTGLTSITIPNSVTSIGWAAFSFCTGLTSVTIPNSVTSIGGHAFSSCTALTSITISNSVTIIYGDTFSFCTSLISVTIPNSVTNIGDNAFGSCASLTSVIIPNSVTNIGDYAFGSCTSLTSVTIPNSVTSICFGAFSDCTALTGSLIIPSSVGIIESEAFFGTNFDTVICEGSIPADMGYDVFKEGLINDIVLVVPCGKQSAYQAADGWSLFANIEEDCHDSYLNDVAEENSILVYPNPATENITLRADEDIFIYNNLGQIVKQINNPKGETTISISDLPRGIYYLKTGNKQQKLIKE